MQSKKTFYALLIAVFAATLGFGSISAVLPALAKRVHANGFWMGMIFSGFVISRGITMPIIGGISKRTGRRWFIIGGLLFSTIFALLHVQARNVYEMTGARVIHGIASGAVIITVLSYGASLIREGQAGVKIRTINIFLYIGTAAGPLIGGIFGHSYGALSVFYVTAAICFTATILAFLFIPNLSKSKLLKEGEARKKTEEKKLTFFEAIKFNMIKSQLIIAAVVSFGIALMASYASSLTANLKINISQTAIIISVGILFSGIFQTMFAKLVNTLKNQWKLYQMLAGMIIVTIGIFIMPLCRNFITLLIASSIIGIGVGATFSSLMIVGILIGRTVGMGFWMRVINIAASVGITIAAIIGGFIMDAWGINAVFYGIGILTIIGTLISCLFIWRRILGIYDVDKVKSELENE